MKTRLLLLGCLLSCLALAACNAALGGSRDHTDAITEYGAAIRWNELDAALAFVEPGQAAALTDLERGRFKQLQVTGYDVKSSRDTADNGRDQDVEIRVVNRNTQIERSVMDHQQWRWDAAAKRYWLMSGLPDFNAESQ